MNEDVVPKKPEPSSVPHVTETPQKAIRTYESDVADVLAHKNISTTNIALAEQKRSSGENRIGESREQEQEKTDGSQNIKKILILLASLVLIGGGVAAGYYFYSLSPLSNTKSIVPQSAPAPTSVIPSDTQVVIPIGNYPNPGNIIAAVRAEMAKPQSPGTIKEIIFTQTINGQTTRVDGPTIAKIMSIPAPDMLLRVLSPSWMLGVYEDQQGKKDIFVIATINYFQNAFAGMLQWENTMADDLKSYLSAQTISDIASSPIIPTSITTTTLTVSSSTVSTSTSTSSSSQSLAFETNYQNYLDNNIIRGSFTDKIVQNKDVREFETSNGPLFLYSFIDSTKLVVTGSESTLSAIISRLEQKAYSR